MKKELFQQVLIAFTAMLLFSQCGTQNKITGVWKADQPIQIEGYRNFFVTALTSNITVRESVETKIASYFTAEGFSTVKSIDVFQPSFQDENNKSDLILEEIRQKGSDTILTLALVDKTPETNYVPEINSYPVPRYGYYSPKVEQYITQYPIDGDNMIGKPKYKDGKVFINETQYFDNVPQVAWEFYIGGYQPAKKWLKDRKHMSEICY